MTTAYTPNLNDIQSLLTRHPDKFSSVLNTQRSLTAARNQPLVAQATAQNHYQDYLKNGGTPLGPNGEMPTSGQTLDQRFGSASCNCGAAAPCCMRKLTFSCEHGKDRMILPLEDPEKQPILTLVTDKDASPDLMDKITIKPERQASGTCSMPDQIPILHVQGKGDNNYKLDKDVTWTVDYDGLEHLGSNRITQFVSVMKHTVFGNIEGLAKGYDLELYSCARTTEFNSKILVYPKVEWKSSGLTYEMKATYHSNMTFGFKFEFGGNLSGTLHNTSFEIGPQGEIDQEPTPHSQSVIPFLDTVLERMRGLTGQSAGAETTAENRSKIEVNHKFTLGESTFTLAEHPSDHTQVGIDAKVFVGFQPLLGIAATIDVIDLVLTAAKAYPPARAFATALQKARDAAAKGIGDENSVIRAKAVATIYLKGESEVGGGVNITRAPGDKDWDGSGEVNGKIGFTLGGYVSAEGRLFAVEASAKAEGKAETDITATLKTLTRAERSSANGSKFNAKITWGGLKVTYSVEVETGYLWWKSKISREDVIPIQESVDWYDQNF